MAFCSGVHVPSLALMPCHRDLDSVFAKNVAYRPKRRSLSARVHQARGRRACSVHLSRECSGRLTPFIKPKLKSRRNTNEIYRLAERGTRASQAADEQAVTNDSDGTPNPEGYDRCVLCKFAFKNNIDNRQGIC